MKKNRFLLTAAGLLVCLNIGVAFRVMGAGSGDAGEESAYENIAVLTRAMQLIRQDYVDEKKTSYRALTYAAIKGMFNSLDPHSRFMDPKELKGMEDDTRSEFGGLGVTVTWRDSALTIVAPMEDSPGFKAGLLPGDQILKINGESTEQLDLSAAIDRLRGNPGEKVTLTVMRPAGRQIKDYTIERAVIKVASVKDAQILPAKIAGDAKIGYVRITQFNEPTATELRAKLDDLESKGIQALVLDLRNNPGGILEGAVDVCGEFVGPNTMVVSTEGRAASAKKVYKTAADARQRPHYPVAILINGGTASAAEIVSGALRDLKRAILVGETSFGKGSVQSVIELQDGAGVRLTTARYYTPSKQVIHEKGIAPNIRATMTADQENLLMLQHRESLEDSEKKQLESFRDTQLERATDALKGVILYASASAKK
ncbi:MAG: S41 family peptidase [Chthoniobacteraceae bacterium]